MRKLKVGDKVRIRPEASTAFGGCVAPVEKIEQGEHFLWFCVRPRPDGMLHPFARSELRALPNPQTRRKGGSRRTEGDGR